MMARRNAELARDYKVREGQGKEQLREMEEELGRLREQNNEFVARNQDYRGECDRLKGQAKVKESANEKLEEEIKQLNEQIANKRQMHKGQLDALLNEQAADRKIWNVRSGNPRWLGRAPEGAESAG